MKNLFVLLLLFMTNSVFAGSNGYYAALRLSTHGDGGQVYASGEDLDDPDAYSTTSQATLPSTTKDEAIPFYAYAKADAGFIFMGWSAKADGVIVSGDNPYEVMVKASSNKSSQPTTKTLYAHFAQPTQGEYTITLLPAEHGAISLTSLTPNPFNSLYSPLRLPWNWGEQPLKRGEAQYGRNILAQGGNPVNEASTTHSPLFQGEVVPSTRLSISDEGAVGSGRVVQALSNRKGAEALAATTGAPEGAGGEAVLLSGATPVALKAEGAAGYKPFAWYALEGDVKRYLSYSPEYHTTMIGPMTIGCEFIPEEQPVFEVNSDRYTDLQQAVAAAQQSDGLVVLASDGTLPAGTYTIPKDITLLIPYDQHHSYGIDMPKVITDEGWNHVPLNKYRSLTLASGASLKVEGNLVVAAEQFAGGGDCVRKGYIAGGINGAYGYMWLDEGSSIELSSGANLSAWGFICGKGTVTAKSGSHVYEPFLFADWRGGDRTSEFASEENNNTYKVFPANQYYIQNIECPLTLESGASEIALASIEASETSFSSPIHFVGAEKAMFSLGEGSTLTKRYDPSTDRIVVDIQGDASVNSIVLTLDQGIEFSSELYTLPIGSSWDINILSGTTTINNDLCLVPGAKVYVAHGATAIASPQSSPEREGAPEGVVSLFVYDTPTWLANDLVAGTNKSFNPIPQGFWPDYSPMTVDRKIRTDADFGKAQIIVDGDLVVDGYMYVTDDCADITAGYFGTIELKRGAGSQTHTYQYDFTKKDFVAIPVKPVVFNNADGTLFDTSIFAESAKFECRAGHWRVYDPSGIESVNAPSHNAAIYNLHGQRVGATYHGVVVKNGKKIIR